MKTLGERIRELRELNDISLREFAVRLDLSAPFVSDVELGRRFPSVKVLAEMAKVLGASLKDLKEYDTRPPVEDMRRLTSNNPAYGLAFRRVIEQKISPEELMKLANGKRDDKKRK